VRGPHGDWKRRIGVGLSAVLLGLVLSACTNAPGTLTATANPDGSITLNWTPSAVGGGCTSVVGYDVYESTEPGNELAGSALGPLQNANGNNSATVVDGSASSYRISPFNLLPGTTYYFELETVGFETGSTCFESYSNEASATTAGAHSVTGQVSVQLTWYSTADLDLSVTEPDGTVIYYGNTVAADGGTLDHDANAGCENATSSPEETVSWANITQPGTYKIGVNYYEDCGGNGPQGYTVVVSGARSANFSGTINAAGDPEQDYTFNV